MTNFIKNILNANKRIVELEAELAQVKLDKENQEKLLKDYKASIEDFVNVKTDYDKKLADANAERESAIKALQEKHNKEINDLNAKLSDKTLNANRKASEIIESLGVSTEDIPTVRTNVITKDDVMGKLNALKGNERAAFYKANKRLIWEVLENK